MSFTVLIYLIICLFFWVIYASRYRFINIYLAACLTAVAMLIENMASLTQFQMWLCEWQAQKFVYVRLLRRVIIFSHILFIILFNINAILELYIFFNRPFSLQTLSNIFSSKPATDNKTSKSAKTRNEPDSKSLSKTTLSYDSKSTKARPKKNPLKSAKTDDKQQQK